VRGEEEKIRVVAYFREMRWFPEMRIAPPLPSSPTFQSFSQFPFKNVNPSIQIDISFTLLLPFVFTLKNRCSSDDEMKTE